MMTKNWIVAILLVSLGGASAANADTLDRDTAVGAALGAVVGSTVGGRDRALVGGLLGAAVGASISDSGGSTYAYSHPEPYYVPVPVYYQPMPEPVYHHPPNNHGEHHGHRR